MSELPVDAEVEKEIETLIEAELAEDVVVDGETVIPAGETVLVDAADISAGVSSPEPTDAAPAASEPELQQSPAAE